MVWLIVGWLSFGGDGDADRVRVILETRCISCHGPEKQKGGLRLDTRDFLLKGGDSGPAARAGDPDHSLILQAVRHAAGDLKMPPKERLQPDQIDLLGRWINSGLTWSGPTAQPEAPPRIGNAWTDPRNPIVRLFDGKRLDLWSLKPVVKPEGDVAIDQYIDKSLRAQGLHRSPQADPRTLIRRMTLDLTGLPPTPEEITAFLRTPDFEQLVDRLLASPRYGERAARLWLDVVRYADSNG